MIERESHIASPYMHPQWQVKRQAILERDHYQCRNCSDNKNLQVHHRQYHCDVVTKEKVAIWDYEERYLITLCRSCHELGHNQFKVPNYYIKK